MIIPSHALMLSLSPEQAGVLLRLLSAADGATNAEQDAIDCMHSAVAALLDDDEEQSTD